MGNLYNGQSLMSNLVSGFWLHLHQPQRFRLQRIGVGYLEERRLSGIACHHTAITAACTQVSHQRRFSRSLNLPISHPISSAYRPVFPGFFGL